MRNKLVKKLLVGALAATMVWGLTACGGNDSSTDASVQTIESYPLEDSVVMDENVPDSTVEMNTETADAVTEETMGESDASEAAESNVSELTGDEENDVAAMNGEDAIVLTGIWQLDNVKNDSEVLSALFGADLEEGNSLELKEDGMFSYYIGIGVGGDGTYEQADDTVTANVTTYVEQTREAVQLQVQQEEGKTYLVMDYDGENLYWSQAE